MQAQDTATLFLLKLWPWVETNKNRLIAGVAIIAIATLVVWFMVNQSEAKNFAAGRALTQVAITPGDSQAEAYLQVAGQYPGTIAGQRAQLLGAAALFAAGKYSDAQAQFQKYLDAHPDGDFSGTAELGAATCLDAQGKTDLAISSYQQVISSSSDRAAASTAKFDLALIEESQGRLNDAFVLYQDVASASPGSSLGSEANMHLIELKNKMPAGAPAQTPAAPLNSSP